MSRSSRGPGHRPFTAATRVRIPYETFTGRVLALSARLLFLGLMKRFRLLPLLATLVVTIAAVGTVARAAEPAAPNADTVLIFPFENTSRQVSARDYNWIGESFS